ncbi:MAG TPA: hypothetical protein VNS09_25945, partial [Solirubrobacter sp.]|nr:hypothetical protein [Solirubrobacter sp.]
SAAGAWALALVHGGPAVASIALAGVIGLFAPPVGPFARASYGSALREREPLLQRTYALDSAGEEAVVIVAPLLVALLAGLASARVGLAVAGAALLAGTALASRTRLAAGRRDARAAGVRAPLPAALWLLYGALGATAAALGAIDIAVPAVARREGDQSAAGVLLAAMAVATVAGSLLTGRIRWRGAAAWRVAALTAAFAGGVALTATATSELVRLGAALLLPGAALGALLATAYVLADRLAPAGAGTRGFAWLVTANNGGLALGAAVAGGIVERSGPAAGLWLGAACALAAVGPAAAAAVMSARVPARPPVSAAS